MVESLVAGKRKRTSRALDPKLKGCMAFVLPSGAYLTCQDVSRRYPDAEDYYKPSQACPTAVFRVRADASLEPYAVIKIKPELDDFLWTAAPGPVFATVRRENALGVQELSFLRTGGKIVADRPVDLDPERRRATLRKRGRAQYRIADIADPWLIATGVEVGQPLGETLVNLVDSRVVALDGPDGNMLTDVRFSGDGKLMVATAPASDGRHQLLVAPPGKPWKALPLPRGAEHAAFANTRRGVASGENLAQLWSTEDGGKSFHRLHTDLVGNPAAVPISSPRCHENYCEAREWIWTAADIVKQASASLPRWVAGKAPHPGGRPDFKCRR